MSAGANNKPLRVNPLLLLIEFVKDIGSVSMPICLYSDRADEPSGVAGGEDQV